MSTATLIPATTTDARETDLERAICDLAAIAKRQSPGPFEEGLLCGLVVLTRVRDGSGPLVDTSSLDYAMIRMAGFRPE